MRTVLIALLIALAPATPQPEVQARSSSSTCTRWDGVSSPPRYVKVFRIHKKGSRTPAHVDRVPFKLYVMRVMASGAWPAYKPAASLEVGAVAIKQYAAWHVAHHQRGYSWRGQCYDIHPGSPRRGCHGCDGGQYYRSDVKVHSKIRRAVEDTWNVWLYKNGRMFRTGWSGDGGACGRVTDGWHLLEDGVSSCARRGWGMDRIIDAYLRPVKIVRTRTRRLT